MMPVSLSHCYKPLLRVWTLALQVLLVEGLLMWCIQSSLSHVINGIVLAPVYWNTSNPLFKASLSRPVVQVNLYDEIDFVCPHVPLTSSGSTLQDEVTSLSKDKDAIVLLKEYYVIYQVTRDQYEACYVDIGRPLAAAMIVNCSNPRQRRRFTLLFEPFQSIPNAPEYIPGGLYYYITTSTGRLEGLLNTYRGACHYQNMRLVVRVCCENGGDQVGNERDVDQKVHSPMIGDRETLRRSKNNALSKPERQLTTSRATILCHSRNVDDVTLAIVLHAVLFTVTSSFSS